MKHIQSVPTGTVIRMDTYFGAYDFNNEMHTGGWAQASAQSGPRTERQHSRVLPCQTSAATRERRGMRQSSIVPWGQQVYLAPYIKPRLCLLIRICHDACYPCRNAAFTRVFPGLAKLSSQTHGTWHFPAEIAQLLCALFMYECYWHPKHIMMPHVGNGQVRPQFGTHNLVQLNPDFQS